MRQLTVTGSDEDTEVRMHVGDMLIVRLTAVPGTGYSWHVSGGAGGVVTQVGQPGFESSGEPELGGEEQQVYRFHVLSSGVQHLAFRYGRPWEKTKTATKSFSITINAKD
jgi:predicted secreted protein